MNEEGFTNTKGSRVLTYYSNEIVGFDVEPLITLGVIKDLLNFLTGVVEISYFAI